MSCTFSSRDFHSYFKGSKEDLNKLIKESCPDALTYTSSSSDGNDTYTFYLRFSSLDDYKKKVRDLLNFPQRSLMNMEIPHLFPVLFTKKISHLKI